MAEDLQVDFSWAGRGQYKRDDEVAIIVDVLRGSSVVVAALARGSEAVLTAVDVRQAMSLARERGALLVGERKSLRVPGFDFGNSPVEISRANLKGRKIVFTSTNFPRAYRWARKASVRIVGSLLNASSAADYSCAVARQLGVQNIRIVLAGESGESCDDDLAFVGAVAERFEKQGVGLSDATARAAQYVAASGPIALVEHSAHAKRLAELGFEKDVAYCCQLDAFDLVPIGKGDKIEQPSNDSFSVS